MRRSPWLMMMLAALLVWWAARVVPQALGLTSAVVNFGGSLQAGQGTAFVTCTAPATVNPNTALRARGGNTDSRTWTVTCRNNLNTPVDVTMTMGATTPATGTLPTFTWNRTSFTLAAGAQGTAVLTVQATSGTTRRGYSKVVTSSVSATNGLLDYYKDHTFTFTVN